MAVGVYVAAWRRGVISREDDVSAWLGRSSLRPWLFAAGMATLVFALDSPIDRGGDQYLFLMHMIQHLLVMMVAPPLIMLGCCGADRPAAASWRRARQAARAITRPWVACAIFNAVLVIWHVPAFYNATLTNDGLHIFEHVTFIAAGMVLWWPIVEPLRLTPLGSVTPFTKIAVLGVSGVPPTIMGFVFAMAPAALYPFYAAAPRLWGFSPVADQQVAGMIMLGAGNLIYFVAIAVILFRMFGDPDADESEALGAAVGAD